jgi:hypothetical protein
VGFLSSVTAQPLFDLFGLSVCFGAIIMNVRSVPLVSAALLTLFAGCASQAVTDTAVSNEGRNAEELLVIDCLLPGQVRKLGQSLTYLAPRRPVKTTAADCEIRGGEYVAYDRANYATALRVWLPKAKEGDPEAQTYVGEIYEKGLGLEADYTLAAEWYKRAAEEGYARAQINLGYLYESGLGVQRNLVTAMNWYRKASGLKDGDIEYVSSIEAAQRRAARRETAALREEVGELSNELDATRQQLRQRRARIDASERELAALRQQLASARQAKVRTPVSLSVSSSEMIDTASQQELQHRLNAAMSERQRLIAKLAEEQLKTTALSSRLERAETQLLARREELSRLQRELGDTRASLERGKQQETLGNTRLLQLQSQIEHLENVVADTESEIQQLEKARQKQQQDLSEQVQSASTREAELQEKLHNRDREIVALEIELSERSKVIASFEKKLQEAESEQERLTAKLARQQLDARQLRDDLDVAARALAGRQDQLSVMQKELVRAREALSQHRMQQSQQSRQEISRLESRIDALTEALQTQVQEINELEEESGRQELRLSSKLAQAELSERDLQKRLNTRNEELQSLQQQLAMAEEQSARVAQSDARISELENVLLRREREIARQKEEIRRMEMAVAESEAGGSEQTREFASLVAARNVGPTIEIIEPPIAVMRGRPSVALHSEVATLEIIGRVSPVEDLISFRINDQPRQTDENGLFQVPVSIDESNTSIHAVAVDRAGRRASLDFVIVPKTRNALAGKTAMPITGSTSASRTNLEFGSYYALIIGNDNYRHMTDLRTARNDARAVERVLREKYGFNTQLLLDADRYTMLSALNKLMRELTENDNLLIYYAGHGELDSVNLRGYWLPVDAEQDSTTNWISNVTVTDMLNVMSAKHVLVVADSCYSGALTRSSVPRLQGGMSVEAKTEWYRAMNNARARAALTSGGVKPVLDSGGGEHSIFAQAFLEVLQQNDGILESYTLYRHVQTKVKSRGAALRTEQNPQYAPIKYAGHEAGEFLFTPVGSAGKQWPQDRYLASLNRVEPDAPLTSPGPSASLSVLQ